MNRRAFLLGCGLGLGLAAFPVFGEAQNAGPWSDTVYCQSADEAAARATLSAALGVTFDASQPIPTGGARAVMVPGITEWLALPTKDTPGTARPGYWVMLKVRTDRPGYDATMAALQACAQQLDTPSNTFSGD